MFEISSVRVSDPNLLSSVSHVPTTLMHTCSASGLDPNRAHHAAIHMLQDVTVKGKRSHDTWVVEIHSQRYAGVFSKTIPSWQINCIS
jgi:hypothetical protein